MTENQPAFIVTLRPGMNVSRPDAAAVIEAALKFTGIHADVETATVEYGRNFEGMGEEILPIGSRLVRPSEYAERYKRLVGTWARVEAHDFATPAKYREQLAREEGTTK